MHKLVDILGLLFTETFCDCYDLYEIKDFGEDKITFFRETLGLKFKNGSLSLDTLERILKHIKPIELKPFICNYTGKIESKLEGI